MELNKEMLNSIVEGTEKYFNGEIPDEVLEVIGGGRDLQEGEERVRVLQIVKYRNMLRNGEIDKSQYGQFLEALARYHDYIYELPDDPGSFILFKPEDWM